MTPEQIVIIAVALLSYPVWSFGILGYRKPPTHFHPVHDVFGDAHRAQLDALRRAFGSTWTLPAALTACSVVATPWWMWEVFDAHGLIRPFVLVVSGAFAWRAVTMDVDLATGETYGFQRILVVLAWAGCWYHPGCLVLLLHCGATWLRSYYHHQHLPVRSLIMTLSALTALPLFGLTGWPLPDITTPLMFLLLLVSASHYFNAGAKKIKLGPHWYSWIKDNPLHTIAASAYIWGWLRFLPERPVAAFVHSLRRVNIPLQFMTVLFEIGAILILFDVRLAIGC